MMISRTIVAVSQEESRYTLNAALLILQPQALTMVATDGHRLAHIFVKRDLSLKNETRVLLPKKALAEIQTLLNANGVDMVEFASDESTLFFRAGSRILSSRQLTGTFPSYEAIMPRDYPSSMKVSNVEFSRGIQRVAQFADLRSSAVRLKIGNQQLRLSPPTRTPANRRRRWRLHIRESLSSSASTRITCWILQKSRTQKTSASTSKVRM
jgi:DNA polymerase-3 subunit beta